MSRLFHFGGGVYRLCSPRVRRSAITGHFLTGDQVTISRRPLRALQHAGYKCQARTPEGYRCNAPAGKVDRATGVVVCSEHFTRTG
jgi:hypothetical protein